MKCPCIQWRIQRGAQGARAPPVKMGTTPGKLLITPLSQPLRINVKMSVFPSRKELKSCSLYHQEVIKSPLWGYILY